eukprot:CCRYP_015766-RA/>CCRYP_015766-RA protein AED:0.43 eAED:0.50 QI:0/0/0/1/0/0/3/0/356
MTCPQLGRWLPSSMPLLDIQSNPYGYRPSNLASTTHGRASPTLCIAQLLTRPSKAKWPNHGNTSDLPPTPRTASRLSPHYHNKKLTSSPSHLTRYSPMTLAASTPSSGNQYIMIAFHADTIAILVRPFPNKHDAHRITAHQDIHAHLSNANRKPLVHILDNEASLAFQQAITSNGCTFQLVPPHVHRRNAADYTIRMFKDHFLAVLAGTAPSFPANDGTYSSHMQNSHLTSYAPATAIRHSLLGKTSLVLSTLTPHHWDQWGATYLSTAKQLRGALGIIAVMRGSTLDQHFTTIAATASSTKNCALWPSQMPSNSDTITYPPWTSQLKKKSLQRTSATMSCHKIPRGETTSNLQTA